MSYFEILPIIQCTVVDNCNRWNYNVSVKISPVLTLEYCENHVHEFKAYGADGNPIEVDDLSKMHPDELFQYSLICPIRYDLERLRCIQVALKDYIPVHGSSIVESKLMVKMPTPDYMLSDDEFYEKHYPGKIWKS